MLFPAEALAEVDSDNESSIHLQNLSDVIISKHSVCSVYKTVARSNLPPQLGKTLCFSRFEVINTTCYPYKSEKIQVQLTTPLLIISENI